MKKINFIALAAIIIVVVLIFVANQASAHSIDFDGDASCEATATTGERVAWACSIAGGTPPPDPDPPPPPPPPQPGPGEWPAELPQPSMNPDTMTACAAPTFDGDKWYTLSGNNCVSTGINIFGASLRVEGSGVWVRDFRINGDGTDKVGVRVNGSNVVIENGEVSHLLGNDKHCYTTAGGARDVWIIKSKGYYCSGDGFQAGHQSSSNPPTNIYLWANQFWENGENGIDLKYINNFIAVENRHWGMVRRPSDSLWCLPDDPTRCAMQNSGSDGTAIVVGSDGGPTGYAFYREEMFDSDAGMRIEEANSDGIVQGTHCHDVANFCFKLDKKSGRIQYSGNIVERTTRGILQDWRTNFALDVDGNLFKDLTGPAIEYESRTVCEVSTLTNNTFDNAMPVICGNTQANDQASVNALPGASGNLVQ